MYDSPKAAHLLLEINGEAVPTWDLYGIQIRWIAARSLEKAGISDMLRVREPDLMRIDEVLSEVNHQLSEGSGKNVVIRLQDSYVTSECRP